MLNKSSSENNPPSSSGYDLAFERDLLGRIRSRDPGVAAVARTDLSNYCHQQARPVLRKIYDYHDREEVSQEVDIFVQDKIMVYEDRGIPLAHYIKRVAVIKRKEYFRQWQLHRKRIDPAEMTAALRHVRRPPATYDDLPDDLDRGEVTLLIMAALDNLKPLERAILMLIYFNGITNATEVSARLNHSTDSSPWDNKSIKPDNVRQIHRRALQRLRTMGLWQIFDDLCLY